MGHMQHTQANASGVAVPVAVEKSFAVTQATWRFYANDRVTPQALVAPLQQFAREQIAGLTVPSNTNATVLDDTATTISDDTATGLPYVLAVVDWSKIDDKKHTAILCFKMQHPCELFYDAK